MELSNFKKEPCLFTNNYDRMANSSITYILNRILLWIFSREGELTMTDLNKREKVIASRLNVARKVRGYNIVYMARLVHIPVATYKNYEMRDTNVPVGSIFNIVIALDCSKDFLTKQKGVIKFNGDKITIK